MSFCLHKGVSGRGSENVALLTHLKSFQRGGRSEHANLKYIQGLVALCPWSSDGSFMTQSQASESGFAQMSVFHHQVKKVVS